MVGNTRRQYTVQCREQPALLRLQRRSAVDGAGEPGTVIDDRLTIACGEGAVRPLLIQRAGRPAMATEDMLRGRAIPMGTRLE